MRFFTLEREDGKMNENEIDLSPLASIDGFRAAALIDADSGLKIATIGSGVNMAVAAAGNTQVYNTKRSVASSVDPGDPIEEIIITLQKGYHLFRPLSSNPEIGLYLVLDRTKANLAMARRSLKVFESSFQYS